MERNANGESGPAALRAADLPSRLALAALLALPAAMTAAYAFMGGGYFVGSTGAGATALLIVLALRATLAREPLAGASRALLLAAGALTALAIWILVSAQWSGSASRALHEFDRALLYLAALTLFGSIPRTHERVAWAVRGLTLAVVGVSAVGLVTRVLPELWSVELPIAAERLSYPLTYWNALGLMAALGVVLCLHHTCSEREPAWARVAGAALLPVAASCLYLTLSRGAIAVAIVAVLAYLALARPWGAIGGLVVAVPTTAYAVSAAYGAELLTTNRPTTPAAVDQGSEAAAAIALAVVVAGILRALLIPLDRRLGAVRIRPDLRRAALGATTLAAVALAAVLAVALDVPERVDRQYDRFVEGQTIEVENDPRTRLTDVGNNGRIDQWQVAVDAFETSPVTGDGAGAYAIAWARDRPIDVKVEDAHSLYLETLAELGLVGLALLLLAIGTVVVGFAARARGEDRHLYAALLAVAIAWAVHAGIDWDWELPALTLWLWALGGMALAAPARAAPSWRPARLTRVLIGLGCLLVALTPASMALSQQKLDTAVDAFLAGDCDTAIDASLDSIARMPVRPQPFEVLGYCDARLGLDRLAAGAFRSAIERDEENWELHYGLAIVRAAARRDPRPAARRALRLNPRGELTRRAVRAFDGDDPAEWRRRALAARLPIGGE